MLLCEVEKMKRLKYLVSVMLIFACVVFASAKEADVVVSLQIDNPIMAVNGTFAEIDIGRGTKPLILNGRTLVPIRAIIESFGGTVDWVANTKTVLLTMDQDTIQLVINSKTAYLNGEAKTLDVAPAVLNQRTMLPIRFIAEGFNLGVGWDGDDKTVYIVRNQFEEEEYQRVIKQVPEYSGKPYVVLNQNQPFFEDYELIGASFEYYSNLDDLGRCDVCMASVSTDLMPTDNRESISSVTPTGWINQKYGSIEGKYLYNRCHLIGYQLTGENVNSRNLITGTRYLNIEGMLPFENQIDDYVEKTGNHVVYRVTPVFSDENLVADGVLLEAYSVEDGGKGITFCIYCYNVQPQIVIDYATGESKQMQAESEMQEERAVYRTPNGKKYHLDPECGGKNSEKTTIEEANESQLAPCSKCASTLSRVE